MAGCANYCSDRNPQASWYGVKKRVKLALNAEGELIFIFDKFGLTEYWREQVTSKTWAHPAFSGDRFYARDDQSVVCFKLPTN